MAHGQLQVKATLGMTGRRRSGRPARDSPLAVQVSPAAPALLQDGLTAGTKKSLERDLAKTSLQIIKQ